MCCRKAAVTSRAPQSRCTTSRSVRRTAPPSKCQPASRGCPVAACRACRAEPASRNFFTQGTIMKYMPTLVLAAAGLLTTGNALADCAADATVAEVRAAHARGQQREKAGDARGALGAY